MHLGHILVTLVAASTCLVHGDTNPRHTESCSDSTCRLKRHEEKLKYLPKPMLILYWTTFYGHSDFEFGFGQQPFIDAKCRVTNCIATDDKSRSKDADALIFHMRNVDSKTRYPKERGPNQKYVFFLLEHPYHQWNDLRPFNGFFNLTMTYRRDSDVFLPYGRIKKGKFKEDLAFAKQHRKLVAWFVSNCESHSKREDYVKELQKYIDVDVYGKCGPLKCPPDVTQYHTIRMWPGCYHMLEDNYKFYISFENNFCKDYVTEKMFNILKLDVVPIVLGGTNYTRDAPPNSVINIEDFDSPKQLAEYLIELDKNQKKYLEYFKWKRNYKVVDGKPYKEAFCRLCEILNDVYPRQNHPDLDEWWGKEKYCDVNKMSKLKQKWNVK